MKISKLHINSFRHLENLKFDFTYPDDFRVVEKRGKPLDKICFIGQSATGKTGLLELIYEFTLNSLNLELIDGRCLSGMRNMPKMLDGVIDFTFNDSTISYTKNKVFYKEQIFVYQNIGGTVTDLISEEDKNDVIYFKSDLISDHNMKLFSKNPADVEQEHVNEIQGLVHYYGLSHKNGMLFNNEVKPFTWIFLLREILSYRKKFTQKMSDLIHKGFLANQKKLQIEYEKWQQENPNVVQDIALKLNPILEKLNLEVDTINTEFLIPIKNKTTSDVSPIQNVSTGTKQLLLTVLPLYKLETKNSIILIDEPERSLYPDMQMDIMEHYQNLAPEAQFIVATHSPFIAASFEPEERFILYFDEKGKVQVRQGKSPIGDDPNDMLKNDFQLESLMNEKGIEAFEKYRNLKRNLASEENETKKDELLEEILSLANAYKF